MTDLKKLRLKLNGSWREVETRPDRILLDLLREDLGLTGTKKGCEQGECGACTILMNGKAVLSCLIPALKGRRRRDFDGRGDGTRRSTPSLAAGLLGRRRRAMRVLHSGHAPHGQSPAR